MFIDEADPVLGDVDAGWSPSGALAVALGRPRFKANITMR